MSKLEVNISSILKEKERSTSKMSITPKIAYGIRTDIPHNIQYFAWDKCCYVAGNYVIIYSIREKNQYFYPAHPDFGEITAFAVDEYLDTIMLVIAQKPQILLVRFINRLSYQEIDTKLIDSTETDKQEHYLSVSVSVSRGYIAALTGPKIPANVKIYQEEAKGNRRWNTTIKMTNQTSYRSILINPHYPYYFAAYGDGGFCVLQISEQDKKTVTRLEADPRSTLFQEFSSFIYTFVSCTWISKSRVAFLNSLCDVFVIDFFNKQKVDNVYKKAIKSTNIFETQSRGRGIFTRNGNLFICKDDGMIVKLEDKQQTEKIILYEKVHRNSKFVQNLPRMDVHSVSLSNTIGNSLNFSGLLITSVSGQIYYIDITNEHSLSDGNNYKYLISPFHSEEITCIDVSCLKPMVVTCSKDRYVCIWNYQTGALEISQFFEEEPLRVTFHPNGVHIGILFKEKFVIIDILEKKFSNLREVNIYSPCDIKFNYWGNLFSVVYKNCFQIYNFYTLEIINNYKSLEGVQMHTDQVSCLTWDEDGTGLATCGYDGRAYYWKMYPSGGEKTLIEYSNRTYKFIHCDVYTDKDTNAKKILLLDETSIVEIEQILADGEDDKSKLDTDRVETNVNNSKSIKRKVIFTHPLFSGFKYDHESRLLITSTFEQHMPSLYLSVYPFNGEKKEISNFQANSHGIRCIKTTQDMKHLFTSGKDKSLFFFEFHNVNKYVRKDDALITHDLTLIKKSDYDKEFMELKVVLEKFDTDILKERSLFEEKAKEIEKEIAGCIREEKETKENHAKERELIEGKIKEKILEYEWELKSLQEDQLAKLKELELEYHRNKIAKEKDKERELDLFNMEVSKDEANLRNQVKIYDTEFEDTKNKYNKMIEVNKEDNKRMNNKYLEGSDAIEKIKSDKIDLNDGLISLKRIQLEDLKKHYDKVKTDHLKDEEKFKIEIRELKSIIKFEEAKKLEGRNNLNLIISDNAKLLKNITELQNDKREKEETILDKNNTKRELERENQELEKFKFVLNYKIKELKQEKDPKENKLSNLERQARDMEKEIKNFEFSQANYIVGLSTNHEIMKLHERQIVETEKSIEKLQHYIKLFQDTLYSSMKKVKNFKEIRKELVNLKELFLDKEFIDDIQKPFESNFEFQRNFLETSINDYKAKLETEVKFLSQDFIKIMRENRKLLNIVNELEIEKKEISLPKNLNPISKSISFTKPKITIKAALPKISINREKSIESKIRFLKKEYYEIEKKLMFRVESKKKEAQKIEQQRKKERAYSRSPDGMKEGI